MTNQQIQYLINDDFFIKKYGSTKLVETHISWVVLVRDFVFKIKKPCHYSFLDFSTIEKRKYFCERELKLNRRLAADMYLSIVPVLENKGQLSVEEGKGQVIDYAVKMKRMDETRQMNLLLENGNVTQSNLNQLAIQLARFHKNTDKIKTEIDIQSIENDFADILNVNGFVEKNIGKKEALVVEDAVSFSKLFLSTHAKRILERHEIGFTIDGHGDLYSQNIFLPKNSAPVIFDCIEFDDHFRHVDVLNDLAFFCMDLEYYKKSDLAKYFLEKYNQENPCLLNQEDFDLFQFYKLYRANVRTKVGVLKTMEIKDEQQLKKQLKIVNNYLLLISKYLYEFKENHTRKEQSRNNAKGLIQ